MKIIAFAAAAGATLALATAADAKPKWHDNDQLRWDPRHPAYAQNHPHGTPPGLAKKPYGMPPGQAKKMGLYRSGQHLPRDYYINRNYYLSDYGRYQLRAPPPGYRWVRVGNDVYLAQTRTGLIAEVIAGLFD